MLTRNLLRSLPLFFLLAGIVFFSLPETGHSGILVPGPQCCQFEENGCFDIIQDGRLCLVEDTVPGVCNESTGVCEQAAAEVSPIPTLSQWGALAAIVAIGIAGVIYFLRRRAAAEESAPHLTCAVISSAREKSVLICHCERSAAISLLPFPLLPPLRKRGAGGI